MAQDSDASKSKVKEMNVDMPDETQETDLVDKGQWQLETGIVYNKFKEGPSATIGQALLRYGLLDRLELRLLAEDGRQRDRYMEETVQSTYPLALGVKVGLLKDAGRLPDVTLVSYLKLPFTSKTKDQEAYWAPIFLLAFQHNFGSKWKLEYNVGIQQEAFSTDWAWLGNGSIHYKITEPFEIHAEYFAQYASGKNPQHNVGAGFAWQLGNFTEVYLSAGTSLFDEEWNHYLNGGIAFRTP